MKNIIVSTVTLLLACSLMTGLSYSRMSLSYMKGEHKSYDYEGSEMGGSVAITESVLITAAYIDTEIDNVNVSYL